MEVITTLTLEEAHKILLEEMRHWRMHFKVTLELWLAMVGCRWIEKETGDGTFAKIDSDGEGKEFDYCGICNFISEAIINGTDEKVLFYWDYDADKKEYTLMDIDIPESLRKVALQKEYAPCVATHDKLSLAPKNALAEEGETKITTTNKLYVDFKTCARYMAFVPDTDDDNRHFEDWIINACLPLIKRICKNADLHEVDWQPFDDVDKFICKAEATGILLATKRFPKNSKIVIEYECTPNGIDIHAPKLLTEDGKELPDLDLYSEPITYLPKDRWVQVTKHERLLSSDEIIEGFWVLKNSNEATYSQWLMMTAGTIMQINMGGADVMTNWTEHEAPITWHEALERLLNDYDYTYSFKVTYSMEHMLEDIGANSYKQLNIYSCEPIKD